MGQLRCRRKSHEGLYGQAEVGYLLAAGQVVRVQCTWQDTSSLNGVSQCSVEHTVQALGVWDPESPIRSEGTVHSTGSSVHRMLITSSAAWDT